MRFDTTHADGVAAWTAADAFLCLAQAPVVPEASEQHPFYSFIDRYCT